MMMAPRLYCQLPDCMRGEGAEVNGRWMMQPQWEMMEQMLEALKIHMDRHKLGGSANQTSQQQNRIPKGIVPTLQLGITNQEWSYFEGKWA